MRASRKIFIAFLENRLTPESAKSYLSYVDAFSRAVGKGEEHYFSSTDHYEELTELLNGKINKNKDFTKHSKKFQSNIKTGIRALLKFYLFVENSTSITEDRKAKMLSGWSRNEILEFYLEKYGRWLEKLHIKKNGERFKSSKNYMNGLKHAITDLKIDPREFFSFTNPLDIRIFSIHVNDSSIFQERSATARGDINSSINKYRFYIAEKCGVKTQSLF